MEELFNLPTNCINLLEKYNLLTTLVERSVIENKTNKVGLHVNEIKLIKDSFLSSKSFNEEEFKDWLKNNKISEDQLIHSLSKQIRINKYAKEKFLTKSNLHFLNRKKSLDQVTYSLIRVKDPYLANELYLRIKEKESTFGEIAKQFSVGEERHSLGIIGPQSLSQPHPEMSEKLRSMKEGELSKPFRIENWFLIVKLELFTEAIMDEAMELQMSIELFQNWIKDEVKDLVEKIRIEQNMEMEKI